MKRRRIGLAVLIAATVAATAWVTVERLRWFEIPTTIDHFAAQGLGGDYEAPGKAASQLLRDARQRLGLIGISAAVSVDGQVVWAAAAGFAELEDHPRSLTPETAFRIGSTVLKKPFLEALHEEVLLPLHMNATGGDHAYMKPENIAAFYEVKGPEAKRWRDVNLSQKWPSGGLVATSSDLARLCGGWFDAKYLSPATVATFWGRSG